MSWDRDLEFFDAEVKPYIDEGDAEDLWFDEDGEVIIPEPFDLMGMELPDKAEVLEGEHIAGSVVVLVKHRFSSSYAIYMCDGAQTQRSRAFSQQDHAMIEYKKIKGRLYGPEELRIEDGPVGPAPRPAGWGRFA